MKPFYESMSKKDLYKSWQFWEKTAKTNDDALTYYRGELEKAHTLLGRIIHQCSERWDTVNLTKHFPTDNLRRKRNVNNPSGKVKQANEE